MHIPPTSNDISCLIILATEPNSKKVWTLKNQKSTNKTAIPGDHLLLFVRSISTAAQVDAGRRQEVKAVILKVLVQ